jgi:hypothetical protein
MKLILRKDDNTEVELKEVQSIGKDSEILVIKVHYTYKPEDVEVLERNLSEKFGKKVIVLDGKFGEIIGV